MEELLEKIKNVFTKQPTSEAKILSEQVGKVQEEMAVALHNFQNTTEPELVDYYSYSLKAQQVKHAYLLRQLKQVYYN